MVEISLTKTSNDFFCDESIFLMNQTPSNEMAPEGGKLRCPRGWHERLRHAKHTLPIKRIAFDGLKRSATRHSLQSIDQYV